MVMSYHMEWLVCGRAVWLDDWKRRGDETDR